MMIDNDVMIMVVIIGATVMVVGGGDNSVDQNNQNYQYDDNVCFHDNADDHDYCINFRDHHQVGAWKGKQVPGDQWPRITLYF